jgi:hypothetical protein
MSAMIEVSMLLHRESLWELRRLLRHDRIEQGIAVSASFVELARSHPAMLAELARLFDVPVGDAIRDSDVEMLRPLLERLDPHSYRKVGPAGEPRQEGVVEGLQTSNLDRRVVAILIDEWDYLIGLSWLFSKTRSAFDKFVRAGANAIETGQQWFERHARSRLKIPPDKSITPAHEVRLAAKWIAVGGQSLSTILAVTAPVDFGITGATISAGANLFLYFDP